MWQSILGGCAWILYKLATLVGDWGLAIIISTLVIRLILFPIQRKQFKSTFAMQQLQPQIQRIQELYAGDQQKIQEETMKIYQETGFNPLAGCLPMLVQMPIFIILFQTLRNKLVDYADMGVSFYNILPDLTITIQQAFHTVSIGNSICYVLVGLCFIVFSVAPMVLQLKSNPQQQQQTTVMLIVMGIMFVWMCWISPAGVMLYWALSSAFGFVQQLIQNRVMKKEAAEEDEKVHYKPVEVNVVRKEKKKRPHKKR